MKRKAAANEFYEQVQEAMAPMPAPQGLPPGAPSPASRPAGFAGPPSSEELQLNKEPIRIRETGYWFRKRVIVPPNAFVVHTRMGRKQPVTIGLGCSFRYNPYRDSYLVVPAAMQTIGIVANSITREKQGINVLAYLQWQIEDFGVAYRRLDFSDSRDPLGIVNAQLREQAEAAIKDKVATMSVDEVLTDKAPVIEELTARLKTVAEGRRGHESGSESADGLGIKIVTVQIREAIVSSQKLWSDLQAPFRHSQAQNAQVSQLGMEAEVRRKEIDMRRETEIREAESALQIQRIQEETAEERSRLEIRAHERSRELAASEHSLKQHVQEQSDALALQEQRARLARQNEEKAVERELEQARSVLEAEIEKRKTEWYRMRQENQNSINREALAARLIEALPTIARELPEIQELRVLSDSANGGADALVNLVARLMAVLESSGVVGKSAADAASSV